MIKVAIYGIDGLYNYGCEAIIRGTVNFIRMQNADVQITYYSKNYLQDIKQIADLNIIVKNIESSETFYKKIVKKLVKILKFPFIPFLKPEFNEILSESDIVYSVGGDIYSIPKYRRENKKYEYLNKMIEFGKAAQKLNKQFVIYGASIGPFGEYKKAIEYYKNNLKTANRIICREYETIEYLKKIGITSNVCFLPDPAFIVESSGAISKSSGNFIGINLSELSFREIYGHHDFDEKIKHIATILSSISIKIERPLLFIPHVFSNVSHIDNDYKFMISIYNFLEDGVKENSLIVKPNSYIDTKKYINQCQFVIAARMHCAINSITELTPAIFLSYSVKSKGMANLIYGNDDSILPLYEIEKLYDLSIRFEKDLFEKSERINMFLKEVVGYYENFISNNVLFEDKL